MNCISGWDYHTPDNEIIFIQKNKDTWQLFELCKFKYTPYYQYKDSYSIEEIENLLDREIIVQYRESELDNIDNNELTYI